MTPVPPLNFAEMLARGLGRAHVVLEADGPEPTHIDALMDACLFNRAYDLQVEGSRSDWLLELVTLAGVGEQLASALAGSLADTTVKDHDHTLEQRWELAGELASAFPSLRSAMYESLPLLVDTWQREPRLIGDPQGYQAILFPPMEPVRQLARLDGVDGAVFALAQMGRMAEAKLYRFDEDVLDDVKEVTGEAIDQALAGSRQDEPALDALLTQIEGYAAERAQRKAAKRRARPSRADRRREAAWSLPWTEAREAIASQVRGTGHIGVQWSRWGDRAPDQELMAAAEALVAVPRDDVELLRPYLAIFRRRPFPLDPRPLIELLGDQRKQIAWLAADALEHVTHPAVRQAALRMADRGPLGERSLDLLAANWRPGDENLAERLLETEHDVDNLHSLVWGLRDVAERNLSPALVASLLIGYELTPCSQCRGHVVKALIRVNELPTRIRRECRWDCL